MPHRNGFIEGDRFFRFMLDAQQLQDSPRGKKANGQRNSRATMSRRRASRDYLSTSNGGLSLPFTTPAQINTNSSEGGQF